MGAGHDHGAGGHTNERQLWLALCPTAMFMIAEIIGGIWTNSLALLSDAGHMATDIAGLGIAIAAIRIGRRPPDARRTFGYERMEILAAAFNALLLFGVAFFILYEAWRRLQQPPEIQSTAMLWIAVLGLAVNFFSMRVLASGKDSSLNVKGAYLEVWSDFLGSIGVIAAALVIQLTGATWVDSLVAVGIGFWVLPRTWTLFKSATNVLLEGVPEGIDPRAVRTAMLAISGISGVHDLHIWSLTGGKVCLTAHAVVPSMANPQVVAPDILPALRHMLADRFDIHHVTVQCEAEPCDDAHNGHDFI